MGPFYDKDIKSAVQEERIMEILKIQNLSKIYGAGETERVRAAIDTAYAAFLIVAIPISLAAFFLTDPILYLLQEMQTLELDGCVRAVCCTCDCVNYVLEPQELSDAFRRVAACLESGGVFIFDLNTAYKYEQLLGDHTFAESRQEGSFIWENYYDEETRINEYDLTLFIPEAGELYRRYAETHYQRNYKVEQIVDFLQQAGLVCEGMYDDYTDAGVKADSERITFVTRKE